MQLHSNIFLVRFALVFWGRGEAGGGGGGGGLGGGGAFFLEPGLTRPMIYRKDIRTLPLLSFISALTIHLPFPLLGNEKGGGSRNRLLIEYGFGTWQLMSV
jgi:hypothetical protein